MNKRWTEEEWMGRGIDGRQAGEGTRGRGNWSVSKRSGKKC